MLLSNTLSRGVALCRALPFLCVCVSRRSGRSGRGVAVAGVARCSVDPALHAQVLAKRAAQAQQQQSHAEAAAAAAAAFEAKKRQKQREDEGEDEVPEEDEAGEHNNNDGETSASATSSFAATDSQGRCM